MKYLLTIFLISLYSISFGQLDYAIEPSTSYADSTADADHFIAHAMIKNLSDETIVIAWQRINNDIPIGWQSYICSNITCAPPDISMGTFSLTANDSTNLDCYFQPEGNPGTAVVELRLFLTGDTSQVIFVTYNGDAAPVSSYEVLQNKIKVYPNPVRSTLQIEHSIVSVIDLFNSLGQLVKSYKEPRWIDVQTIASGSYYLKMYNKDKELISVTSFQKID